MMRPLTIAACVALTLATVSCAAQEPAAPAAVQAAPEAAATTAMPAPPATPVQGNLEAGRLLAYTCQGCHGVAGYKNAYPNYHVPLIGGQSEVYLANALGAYRTGERQHPTMQAQAQSFSEQDIADIAAYLSTLK